MVGTVRLADSDNPMQLNEQHLSLAVSRRRWPGREATHMWMLWSVEELAAPELGALPALTYPDVDESIFATYSRNWSCANACGNAWKVGKAFCRVEMIPKSVFCFFCLVT